MEATTLSASGTANAGWFGDSCAIYGDTLAVGDPNDSDLGLAAGAVYVYRRSGDDAQEWQPVAKLYASDATKGTNFGGPLALEGDILVVGSYLDSGLGIEEAGAAYVFERPGAASDAWTQTAKLTASDPFRAALFGQSVAVSGSTIAVGASLAKPRDVRCGAAYVFEKTGVPLGEWRETQRLTPEVQKAFQSFGVVLDLVGDSLAVGAPKDDTGILQGGAVYLYSRNRGDFELEALLTAPDASVNDGFGGAVLIRGQVLVGAQGDDDQGLSSGSAYVFTKVGPSWNLSQKLLPVEGEGGDNFGKGLAADKDLFVISAPNSSAQQPDAGIAYSFRRLGDGSWVQSGALQPSGLQPQDIMFAPAVSDGIAVLGILTFPVGGTVHVFDTRLERSVVTYCEASDTGDPDCEPLLEAVGNATASGTSEFRLRAGPVPSGQLGFFAYTYAPSGLPVGNSAWTCLPGPALGRSQLLLSGGTFGVCDGLLELDWNDLLASNAGQDPALAEPGTHVYGQFVHFQFGSVGRVQLSEAVAFVTCP